MLIKTLTVTPFQQNARLLIDEASNECVVVDPGGEIEVISGAISGGSYKVSSILLTHSHIDHAGGVTALESWLKSYQHEPVKLIGHADEQWMREGLGQQATMFGLSPDDYQSVREPDVYLNDGDTVVVGSFSGKVLFTPGHSPGHVSIYFQTPESILIAGDALFQGSIGRTDLPGGDHPTLISSIKKKLLVLPGETVVMPGHGPNTTIEVEKNTNPFLV